MLRRIVRKGIRAVVAEQESNHARGEALGPISTYCQDSVVHVPQRANRNDELVLRDIGRAIARIVIDEDNGTGRDRLARVSQKIAALSEPRIATAAE
jgi:hypothetical protein